MLWKKATTIDDLEVPPYQETQTYGSMSILILATLPCPSAIARFVLLLLEIAAVLYYSGVNKNYMTALQQKNEKDFYHG